jgi:hypothetical protein
MSSEGAGQTYTADWFEFTKDTPVTLSLTGWKVDDDSNSFSLAAPLAGVGGIGPGQSADFVEGTSTTAANFVNSRLGGSAPAGFLIGSYTGSGVGVGANRDQVNLFDSTGTRIANVVFGAATAGRSFDNAAGVNGTIATLSSVGWNGTFAAAAPSTEIGSPGAIPEPGAAASLLAGFGTLLLLRPRRREGMHGPARLR